MTVDLCTDCEHDRPKARCHDPSDATLLEEMETQDLTIRDLRAALRKLVDASAELRHSGALLVFGHDGPHNYPPSELYTAIDSALAEARKHL
jgi:hypothetical protein